MHEDLFFLLLFGLAFGLAIFVALRFTRGTTADPLQELARFEDGIRAEQTKRLLEAEDIKVLITRDLEGASMAHSPWIIRVPESQLARAQNLFRQAPLD